mgnify:FL=1
MALPFTVEEFFGVFEAYNRAMWPLHIVAYGLYVVAVVLLFRRGALSDRVLSAIVGGYWIWTGAAYHIGYFSEINGAAYLFGILFVGEGLLFVAMGTLGRRVQFRFTWDAWGFVGAALFDYATIVYPLLGLLWHRAVEAPWFGLTPCPTVIFTLGLMLFAQGPGRLLLFAIPLSWSVVGGSAAILLDVPQDYGLIAAGVVGTVFLLTHARRDAG